MLLRPKRRYQPSTLHGVKFQNIPRREKVQNYVNFLSLAASPTQRLNLTCSLSPLEYTRAVWALAAVFCGEVDKKSSHRHWAGSELIFSWIIHAINFVRLETCYKVT